MILLSCLPPENNYFFAYLLKTGSFLSLAVMTAIHAGGPIIIVIACMLYLIPFLDLIKKSMLTVSMLSPTK